MPVSFTDPLSITITGATSALPRVSSGEHESEYLSADGLIKLTAQHSSAARAKRMRRVLRIDHNKMAPDPFRPDENRAVSMSNYIVFDLPSWGYTNAEQLAVYTGFKTLYTATSDAMIIKLLGGES